MSKTTPNPSGPDGPYALLDSDFLKRYQIGDYLGKGSYAQVYAAIERGTNRPVALKIMSKERLGQKGEASVRGEVQVMAALHHPKILRLHQAVFSAKAVTLVTDVVKGGELFKHLVKLEHYSERTAAEVMRNLMLAMKYMHEEGYCHRDLKPDNLLLMEKPKNKEEVTNICVADFGFATKYRGVPLTQPCGTPYYIAPDVLDVGLHKTKPHYDERVDNWSCGVIAYIVLCGYPPFHADHKAKLFKAISEARVNFSHPPWNEISADAKDFVCGLLHRDCTKRLTAAQALKHRWLESVASVNDIHLSSSIENLSQFCARRKIKGTIFGVEATLRLSYLAGCQQAHAKENSKIMELLTMADSPLTSVDLSGNYLGPKGLEILIKCLAQHSEVQELILTNSLIDDEQAKALLDAIASTPSKIRRIVLDENPITHPTARRILAILQSRRSFSECSILNSRATLALQRKVQAQSEYNRAADQNERKAKEQAGRLPAIDSHRTSPQTTPRNTTPRTEVSARVQAHVQQTQSRVVSLPPIDRDDPRSKVQSAPVPGKHNAHPPGRHLVSRLRQQGKLIQAVKRMER